MKARIFLVLGTLLSLSCRTLIWSDAEEFYEAYWLNEDQVVESVLRYREKVPFPPIAVTTTLKKDYKTLLCLIRVRPDNSLEECGKRIEVAGQQINGAYRMGSVFVMLVVKNPDAPEERELVGVDLSSGQSRVLWKAPMDGWTISEIVASPDRNRLAVVWQKGQESRISITDGVPAGEEKNPPGIPVTVTGRNVQVAWGKDSDKVFIPRDSDVLEIHGKSGSLEAGKAVRFPRCFQPPTRYAGRTSDQGRSYFRENLAAKGSVTRVDGWRQFSTLPETTKFDEVGAGCP